MSKFKLKTYCIILCIEKILSILALLSILFCIFCFFMGSYFIIFGVIFFKTFVAFLILYITVLLFIKYKIDFSKVAKKTKFEQFVMKKTRYILFYIFFTIAPLLSVVVYEYNFKEPESLLIREIMKAKPTHNYDLKMVLRPYLDPKLKGKTQDEILDYFKSNGFKCNLDDEYIFCRFERFMHRNFWIFILKIDYNGNLVFALKDIK